MDYSNFDKAMGDLLHQLKGVKDSFDWYTPKKRVYATIDISDFTVLQIEEMAREGIIKEIKYN